MQDDCIQVALELPGLKILPGVVFLVIPDIPISAILAAAPLLDRSGEIRVQKVHHVKTQPRNDSISLRKG